MEDIIQSWMNIFSEIIMVAGYLALGVFAYILFIEKSRDERVYAIKVYLVLQAIYHLFATMSYFGFNFPWISAISRFILAVSVIWILIIYPYIVINVRKPMEAGPDEVSSRESQIERLKEQRRDFERIRSDKPPDNATR